MKISGHRCWNGRSRGTARPASFIAMILPLLLLLQKNGVSSFTTTTLLQPSIVKIDTHNHHQYEDSINASQSRRPGLSSIITRKTPFQRQTQALHMSTFTRMFDFVPPSSNYFLPRSNILVGSDRPNDDYDHVDRLLKKEETSSLSKPKELVWPIASGQEQISIFERVGKVRTIYLKYQHCIHY